MMKKALLSLSLCAFLAVPTASNAEDMAKISCKEINGLIEGKKTDQFSQFILWADGYMSADSDVTVVNQQWIEHLSKHVLETCAKDPNKTFLDAALDTPEMQVEGGQDIFEATCKETVLSGNEGEIANTLMWVDGYLSMKNKNTEMTEESMQKLATDLVGYCQKNGPSATLGGALK